MTSFSVDEFPEWTPLEMVPVLRETVKVTSTNGLEFLNRLIHDERMRDVYFELFRKDRKTGEFFNPIRQHSSNYYPPPATQADAVKQLIQVAVSAARDRVSVSKLEDIQAYKKDWDDKIALIKAFAHDLAVAVDQGSLGIFDEPSKAAAKSDLAALFRVTSWLEYLSNSLRTADDPMVAERNSSIVDPVTRGVQITIGAKLIELFGKSLDGVSAKLTSIVLETETSPGVSRSALRKRKIQD